MRPPTTMRTLVASDAARVDAIARLDALADAEADLRRLDEQLESLQRLRGRAAEQVMEAKLRVRFGNALDVRRTGTVIRTGGMR